MEALFYREKLKEKIKVFVGKASVRSFYPLCHGVKRVNECPIFMI